MNNRNLMKTIMMSTVAIFLASCAGMSVDGEGGEQKQISSQYFYQHWVNSYEEQTDGNIIFRPEGSMEFPASRFRMAYIFNVDGSCQYKYLSPDDAHRMESCVYTKVGNKVYIYDNAGKLIPDLSFTLNSPASKNILRLTKGVQNASPDSKAAKPTDKKAETK